MAPIVVIANLKAGSSISVKDLLEKFHAQSVKATIVTFSEHYKHDIKKALKQDVKIVVAVGGDGTINAVASELYGTKAKLGIIPLGTLNHFAKDCQIPLEIDKAIACIAKGHTKKVDVGRVNKRLFLNNSSVGFYPQLVRERGKQQSWLAKWPAAIVATGILATKLRNHHVTIKYSGKKDFRRRTPLIFVGNNPYDLESEGVASRHELNGSVLGVHIVRAKSIGAIIKLLLQTIVSIRPPRQELESFTTKKLTLSFRKSRIMVALDGEVVHLNTPLHYSSESKKLTVIVP